MLNHLVAGAVEEFPLDRLVRIIANKAAQRVPAMLGSPDRIY